MLWGVTSLPNFRSTVFLCCHNFGRLFLKSTKKTIKRYIMLDFRCKCLVCTDTKSWCIFRVIIIITKKINFNSSFFGIVHLRIICKCVQTDERKKKHRRKKQYYHHHCVKAVNNPWLFTGSKMAYDACIAIHFIDWGKH